MRSEQDSTKLKKVSPILEDLKKAIDDWEEDSRVSVVINQNSKKTSWPAPSKRIQTLSALIIGALLATAGAVKAIFELWEYLKW